MKYIAGFAVILATASGLAYAGALDELPKNDTVASAVNETVKSISFAAVYAKAPAATTAQKHKAPNCGRPTWLHGQCFWHYYDEALGEWSAMKCEDVKR